MMHLILHSPLGATSQGVVSKQNLDSVPSGCTEGTLGRRVETAFNTSIPQQEIKRCREKVDSLAISKNIKKFWFI